MQEKKNPQNVKSLLWHKVVLGGQPYQFSLLLLFGRTFYLLGFVSAGKFLGSGIKDFFFFFPFFCLVSTIDCLDLWSFDWNAFYFLNAKESKSLR